MDSIKEIAEKIKCNGGNLYLVGGAVRDEIIGINEYDEDYCVTGLNEEDFERLFPNCISRGKNFKVYEIDGKEFALARTESKNGKGHRDFDIVANKDITIEEDLKRRDFTINSIAKEVLTGKIIDPYGGIKDIEKKVIRATSEKFAEDPLRAYRAARFACKLEFKVDRETINKMKEIKYELMNLSPERVFEEFRKSLLCRRPSFFFQVLRQAEILDVHFEEIGNLIGVEQPIEYHPEGDAFNHTMLAVDRCALNTSDIKIRFAALVHDLGKALTPVCEYPHHINHDIYGVDEVEKFCKRLKMPNSWLLYGKVAAREHMRAGIFYKMTPNKQVDFIERVSKTKLGLEGLEHVVEADRNCRGDTVDKVEFAKLGERLLKEVNGKKIIEKFGIMDGIKIREKIHEQRVATLKKWRISQNKATE